MWLDCDLDWLTGTQRGLLLVLEWERRVPVVLVDPISVWGGELVPL